VAAMLPEPAASEPSPQSVWPVAQANARDQRRGRYLPDAMRHPARMLPALAARAIATWSRPGDAVVDVMAGVGTTLIEAIHLGRHAVGVEIEPVWVDLARRGIRHARTQGATGSASIHRGDALVLPAALRALQGQVRLVLFSPPYGRAVHGRVDPRPGRGLGAFYRSYSQRAGHTGNLAYRTHQQFLHDMTQILAGCRSLLTPDGTIVITARPWRRSGHLVDVPGAILSAAESAGLQAMERCVALLGALRGQGFQTRPSFFQLHNIRAARAAGRPEHLIAHEDVLALRPAPAPVPVPVTDCCGAVPPIIGNLARRPYQADSIHPSKAEERAA
jgi:modification methylase